MLRASCLRQFSVVMLGVMPWSGLNAQQHATDSTFRVTAHVQAGCQFTAQDSDRIGASQGGALNRTTSLLRPTCTPDSTYDIGFNSSTPRGAIVDEKRILAESQILHYSSTGTGPASAQDHALFGPLAAVRIDPATNNANTVTVRIYY